MNTNQQFEMFFNCIVKSKYNLMFIGEIDLEKTSALVKIFDEAILKLYKIQRLEGFELKFELGKIEEYTDYPYAKILPKDYVEYRVEVFKIIDHLLSHTKELIRFFDNSQDYFVSSGIKSIGENLYNFKLNF